MKLNNNMKPEQTMPIIFIPSTLALWWAGLILILVSLRCDTTEPPNNNLQPGRRDYVWKVDTLYLPFNPFTDITGIAPNDVWVCSPGDADKIFYHFDGTSWKTDSAYRIFSPFSISILTTNNIWSGGYDGRIWQYYNGVWYENKKFALDSTNDIIFESILAIDQTNVLTAGQQIVGQSYWGIILKYDGKSWKQLDISARRTAFSYIKKSDNGKIYLCGLSYEQLTESRYQFYELEASSLKEIYSGSQATNSKDGRLLQLGSKTYFIIGYDFYSYNGSSFNKVGKLSDDPKFLNAGVGRNEKDIFLGMRDGIAHYNGENTVYLYQTLGNVFVRKGIVFEKDVFFLGRDVNGNNLIFHGTLNE